MEPHQQFRPEDFRNAFLSQNTEQLGPKESQVIRDLEDAVSKQGRLRSFRRAATVGIRRAIAEHQYIDLQFHENSLSVEKVHCCNGLVPFAPFSTIINVLCVVSYTMRNSIERNKHILEKKLSRPKDSP